MGPSAFRDMNLACFTRCSITVSTSSSTAAKWTTTSESPKAPSMSHAGSAERRNPRILPTTPLRPGRWVIVEKWRNLLALAVRFHMHGVCVIWAREAWFCLFWGSFCLGEHHKRAFYCWIVPRILGISIVSYAWSTERNEGKGSSKEECSEGGWKAQRCGKESATRKIRRSCEFNDGFFYQDQNEELFGLILWAFRGRGQVCGSLFWHFLLAFGSLLKRSLPRLPSQQQPM